MSDLLLNKLTVAGQPEAVNTIYEAFKSSNIFATLIGKDPAYETYTTDRQEEHNRNTYGTKWDISKNEQGKLCNPQEPFLVDSKRSEEQRFTVEFATVNAPPVTFVETLCKKYKVKALFEFIPDASIAHLSIDEGDKLVFNENGEVIFTL